jgi:pilus assembly protein CpaB
MRMVFALVLLIGLGLAGAAVWMVNDQFAAQQQQAANRVDAVEVVAVKETVEYGDLIEQDDVRLVRMALESLPPGAFINVPRDRLPADSLYFSVEDFFSEAGPRSVLRQMEPNEPVLAIKVSEPGEGAGLGGRLDEGMRAFAISVDVASGVSGLLRPGDRIDVYWTGIRPGSDASGTMGIEVTQLIEAGVEIVAVDQSTDNNLGGAQVARTITVQVDPQQVANLAQAQATGRLTLSLVGHGDTLVASAQEVDQRGLLGLPAPTVEEEVIVEQAEECFIITRRGTEEIQTPTDCPE